MVQPLAADVTPPRDEKVSNCHWCPG